MSNLTIALPDKLLQAARVRAVKENTSVNEICRKAIEAYANPKDYRLERYLELQAEIDALPRLKNSHSSPKQSRDEHYEQMLAERSPASKSSPKH